MSFPYATGLVLGPMESKNEHLVVSVVFPPYFSSKELMGLVQEFRRQIDEIDPTLSELILNWQPDLQSLFVFFTSIAAYPHRKKIRELKVAFSALDSTSVEPRRNITRILLGRVPYTVTRYSLDYTFFNKPSAHEVIEYEQEASKDPDDSDAPLLLPSSLVSAELKRREQWKKKWEEYLVYLKRKYNLSFEPKFYTDLPTSSSAVLKISPRLRLPSGEYLEPVTGSIPLVPPVIPQPLPPAPPVEPQPHPQPMPSVPETPVSNDTTVPVSEEKKDEKKDEKKSFPWWIVIVIGVVVLFFIMKD